VVPGTRSDITFAGGGLGFTKDDPGLLLGSLLYFRRLRRTIFTEFAGDQHRQD